MSDDQDILNLRVLRREEPRLPSRRRHFLLSCLLVFAILVFVVTYTVRRGSPDDALSTGVIPISTPVVTISSDTLNGTSDALPDLLAGEVPLGENPTIAIDALGNPLSSDPARTEPDVSELAGTAITETAEPSAPSGSQTILINGAPLNSTGNTPLTPAPIVGLARRGTYGPVPIIGPNGAKAVTHYNRPFTPVAGKKPVSVVIGGLGINRSVTQRAIDELPAAVTLAFAAHSRELQNWVDKARAKGHEVLLEIPMESKDFDPTEPGANRTLMASRDTQNNIRNLDWLLSRAQGYCGVINFNGDVFLTRSDQAAPFLDKLSQSGLGLVFDGAHKAPSLQALSRSTGLPYARGFNLIDLQTDSAHIQGQLSQLSSRSKTGTHSLGVGFAFPETIDGVNQWVKTLEQQGLILAPASVLLQ